MLNMNLNPEKCKLGVSSRKVLGFMVSERGIEVNPQKVQAILNMKSLTIIKKIQGLTRRLVVLNRFISKAQLFPIFSGYQKRKRYKMDRRVGSKLPRVESLSSKSTSSSEPADKGHVVPIFDGHWSCNELSVGKRGRKDPPTNLLYEQIIAGRGVALRKIGSRAVHHSMEVKAILLSILNCGILQPTFATNIA